MCQMTNLQINQSIKSLIRYIMTFTTHYSDSKVCVCVLLLVATDIIENVNDTQLCNSVPTQPCILNIAPVCLFTITLESQS